MLKRGNAAVVAAFMGLVALYVATNAPSLYADYLWFVSVGYETVFLKVFAYRAVVFAVFGLVAFVAFYASFRVTTRNIRKHDPSYSPSAWYTVAVVVASVAVGAAYSGAWETFLLFVNAEPFGTVDPYFGRSVAFYVFSLPAYEAVVGYLLLLVFASFLGAVAVYAYEFGLEKYEDAIGIDELDASRIEFDPGAFARRISEYAYGHVTASVGSLLVVLSFNFYLSRLRLVYSESGAVFGVGATEASVVSPALLVLSVVALVGGIAVVANAHVRLRDRRVVYAAVGAVVVVSLLGTAGAFLHQSYVVEPDEFNQEESYLSNEIEFTRSGFALDRIDEREFDVSENLTRETIEENPGTIDNLRLWDKRPLMQTYNEQNNLRTYYHFNDIKTDRYTFDGDLRQVYISTREIEFDALPEGSRSWVNRHLVYTHGMGFVMSPVSEVGDEGFPEYYVDEIPPRANVDLRIDQPRIYYGETTDSYNIVASGTRELDYPRRGDNAYYDYTGDGGVPLSSTFRKLAYSLRFGDYQIYFSNSVTDDSKVQMNRDLETRVNEVAPFLEYDDDPYPAVVNGRVKWIYDAYTTTDRYPYSARYPFNGDRVNYLRNSVKVVVDAYSGETTFYVTEDDDPIVNTYRNVFPSLFEDMEEMSPELRDHVRYPQDAFETQSRVNLVYHMQDEQEFYNREDEWRIPEEEVSGETVPVEPYYIVMKLPGEEEPEFIQILPFIPEARENLIGWMAARSDRPNYGEIRSFLLSQQDLIFGPQQVESRIDQNTEISQSITLWSQAGSSVDRGNLLAVPIEDTILYVEPLFLEAQNEGALPQLQRVIVAHNDRVTMQRTLDASLAALFGEVAPPAAPGAPQPSTERIERLRELYEDADSALRGGNFTEYARNIEEIGTVLDEINTTTTNDTVVPDTPSAPVDTPDADELE
ncbi:MAG: UPF0182 family protein [Halobacteria archaeon]